MNYIKTLILADFLYPEYLGGSAKLASEINAELVKDAKYDLSCITRIACGVYSSKFQSIKEYNIVYINEIKKINKLLFRNKWDLVVIHHYLIGILSLFLLFKRPKIVYFFHGPAYLEKKSKGGSFITVSIINIIEYVLLFNCDNIYCLTDYIKNYIPTRFHKKVIITGPLHNYSINTNLLNYNKKTLKFRPINLLTVRRLTNRTGVVELSKLVSNLKGEVNLNIVGVGELYDHIKNFNFDNIKLHGQVNEIELKKLYLETDLVVLPSIELEGFGLTIIESLYNGTPVLASINAGGGADFLDSYSENFIYSLETSPADFLQSIIKAINTFDDQQIRVKIYNTLSDFTITNFIHRDFIKFD